jgi:hypothetical protein
MGKIDENNRFSSPVKILLYFLTQAHFEDGIWSNVNLSLNADSKLY